MESEPPPATDSSPSPPGREVGLLYRMWRVLFLGDREDYEKRLEYIYRKEAAVLSRMRQRSAGSRDILRGFVACAVALEVAVLIYAIIIIRSDDLPWQLRVAKIMPIFLVPGFCFVLYSAVISFTKMCDSQDQKVLEGLRAERKAKIDELKERTNFYSTQQLIQTYDLDPAAKAAAAAVLASKLSADSGLKVFLGDAPILEEPSGRSNNIKLPSSQGLRNRKHSAGGHGNGTTPNPELSSDSAGGSGNGTTLNPELSGKKIEELVPDGQLAPATSELFVEHYKGPASFNGGWPARIVAMLVGEDPTQCYALICGTCHMHNGLVRMEDFPYITYYCPHCHALNTNRQLEGSSPDPNSGNPSIHSEGSADATPLVEDGVPSPTQVENSVISPSGEVREVGEMEVDKSSEQS